jgi:S-adenosylmethionine synthetase
MDGRATTYIENGKEKKSLPVEPTALEGVRKYLKKTYPNLNVDTDVILGTKLGMGSDDLTGVYKASNYLSNDTSFGVGFAPFSITDTLTKETEEYINGAMKKKIPAAGQDVKVMCSRVGKNITMTVCCAMVDKYIEDKEAYKSIMEEMNKLVTENGNKIIDRANADVKLKLDLNTGDDYKRGVYYLTVTGLSQEMGDDGSVGRGNRCNGLITPFRPMSMEATSGKNPITHIGKIYNVMSRLIAEDVAKKVTNEAEIRVRLLSQIGKPVSQPLNASVQIVLPDATEHPKLKKWTGEAEVIAADWLDNVDKVSDMIIEGKVRTF